TGPFGSMVHKSDYMTGGVPLINPSHMISGVIREDASVSVSNEKATTLSSYALAENDIVMARRGEVGRCALVNEREDGWLCGTGSFVLRFHEQVDRYFVLNLFLTQEIRKYLSGNSVGTTMTNLNHGILNKLPVAVPPSSEQKRIVKEIERLVAVCDHLKVRLNQASETRRQLASAVVEQAIY
ncbi:restriction endonuclease subunit S, partial [Salinisphaera sp.]|uniref:restriction endonuclease subunit S n=1 Tax=Salinisphaera sp. TaxID=1914330 RepID=UPI002D767C5A